jgi:hypothetical protein
MWRRMPRATSGLAALLLIATVGCVDLAVQDPNAPDASRALATPGDVQSLIAGAFNRWNYVLAYNGPTMFLSAGAFEHSAPWANSGVEYYGRIPRQPTINSAGDANITNLTEAWYQGYRAIAAIHDGLQQLDAGTVDLADSTVRAKAYGKFMQGLALGTIALLYDSAYVFDENTDPATVQLQGYKDVMTAALGYLDDAITLAGSASFTIPATWMGQAVTSATLIQLAHSYRARFQASVARTPAERQAANWASIVSDANAGVTADWDLNYDCNLPLFCGDGNMGVEYRMYIGWQMQANWVAGMADTSGHYQAWINTPTGDKKPFMIFTPDTRWPQGGDATRADTTNERIQLANPGEYYSMNEGDSRIWSKPDRGTWRWSYYEQTYEPFFSIANSNDKGAVPMVKVEEMKALIAEADYYGGDMQAVADFVNATRTLHGLQATDAGGTNADCVPKLPNGTCGDLWEMFKWEKRLETQFAGPLRIGWYFDGRGWGDLMQGTLLQLPVPYGEMQLLQVAPYNYGGVGGPFAAPTGTYGY